MLSSLGRIRECGVPAKHRFKMPIPTMDSDNFYYSFNVGRLVHMIMIDTEIKEVGPGSEQYDFLETDLQNINRTETRKFISAVY